MGKRTSSTKTQTEVAPYYCSQKFDWLEVRLYDGYVASCCQAKPSKLTRDLLEADKEAFFNWPTIVSERNAMLQNVPVSGCESSCWQLEEQDLPSRRTQIKIHPQYTDVRQLPKTLNIVVNNTCSLTCSYCCKNFSSSWLNDVVHNGSYDILGHEDRYNISTQDLILARSNAKQMNNTSIADLIMSQIKDAKKHIDEVLITGGEPLLYPDLEEIVDMFKGKRVQIFTGLGVPAQRMKKMLPVLTRKGVHVTVSAENTGAYHEFNRYGTKYKDFSKNLAMLKGHPSMNFACTISNLTVIDFPAFAANHADTDIVLNYVFEPAFMNPNLLDPETKERVLAMLESNAPEHYPTIAKWVNSKPDLSQRENLLKFLKRFEQTRDVDLALFPKSFIDWLE